MKQVIMHLYLLAMVINRIKNDIFNICEGGPYFELNW